MRIPPSLELVCIFSDASIRPSLVNTDLHFFCRLTWQFLFEQFRYVFLLFFKTQKNKEICCKFLDKDSHFFHNNSKFRNFKIILIMNQRIPLLHLTES